MRLLFIMILTIVFSCQKPTEIGIVVVDADRVKSLLEDGVTLIDVRTPQEFESGRIEGATLINFLDEDFKAQIGTLDKREPVLLYCGVGGRSKKASEQLMAMGFKTIYDYSGGFSDWKRRGEDFEQSP